MTEEKAAAVAEPSPRDGAQKSPKKAAGAKPGGRPVPAGEQVSGLREFLIRLFGSELALWGLRNGTIDSSLLGRHPKPHPLLADRFPNLHDKQIMATSKAFKTALSNGWEKLSPEQYNGIRYAFDFFRELVQVRPLFGTSLPAEWVQRTQALQKSYMLFLAMPGSRDAVLTLLPQIVERYQEGPKVMQSAGPILHYVADLDRMKPTLRNAITAMHSLTADRLRTWEEIEKVVQPGEPEKRKYLPPGEYAGELYNHVHNAKDRFKKAQGRIKQIDEIQSKYLQKGPGGVPGGALWEPAFLMMQRLMPDDSRFARIEEALQQAHLALYALSKYMLGAYSGLLGGSIKVRSPGSNLSREVAVFRQDVMASIVDQLERLVSSCERAVKAYRNGTIEYSQLDSVDADKDTDPFRRYVRELAVRAHKVFRNLTMAVEAVLSCHKATAQREQSGKEVDARTKEIPIEELSRNARFLPHADSTIAAGALSQATVLKAMEDLLHMLYVGRYLMREPELMRFLESRQDLLNEQQIAFEELQRMGETA